jgi:hypothetical protein
MKAKLIKTIDGYHLRSLIKDIPRSINVYHKISKNEGEFGFGEHSGKLSKQNCDEIFGIFDVEKLADDYGFRVPYDGTNNFYVFAAIKHYKEGFNKAMELNKDKVFTLEDMRQAIEMAREENGLSDNTMSYDYSEDELIQSLQQPTEIEVDIIMRNSRTGNIVKHDSDLEWDEDGLCDRAIPKLDSEGCLILKKI